MLSDQIREQPVAAALLAHDDAAIAGGELRLRELMLEIDPSRIVSVCEFLKTEFTRNLLTRVAAVAVYPVLKAFKRRIDPRRFNGATLVGLKGVVVKSHGGADAFAFTCALKRAAAEVEHGVLDKIAQRISEVPSAGTADNGAAGAARAHA